MDRPRSEGVENTNVHKEEWSNSDDLRQLYSLNWRTLDEWLNTSVKTTRSSLIS